MKLEITLTINRVKYRWGTHTTNLKDALEKALKALTALIGK